jgi:hypothetical protein
MPGSQHPAAMGCVGTGVPAQQQELLLLAVSGLQGCCSCRAPAVCFEASAVVSLLGRLHVHGSCWIKACGLRRETVCWMMVFKQLRVISRLYQASSSDERCKSLSMDGW